MVARQAGRQDGGGGWVAKVNEGSVRGEAKGNVINVQHCKEVEGKINLRTLLSSSPTLRSHLYRLLYGLHLDCHHGQDLHADAIELVKAAPCAGLGQPFVNVAARFVVHLLRTVEDINHYAQCSSQVLGCFRFPGAGWTGGRASHYQMQRLQPGRSNSAPVKYVSVGGLVCVCVLVHANCKRHLFSTNELFNFNTSENAIKSTPNANKLRIQRNLH